MRSIRTQIALLNIISMSVSIVVASTIGAISIANFGHKSSEKELTLLCETGKSNLNYYFKSVEQSVNTISNLIDEDLDQLSESDFTTDLSNHIEKARIFFNEAAKNTNGVLTYYYRIDPSITETTNEKGFWYIDLEGDGFEEHEVTDLSDDNFECLWFYNTKNAGKSIWLPPYVTDNLDIYVVSYNVPVYRHNKFVGVAGIEIDYKTLGEQIDDIKINKTGYAFIIENERGTIIYHPVIDILSLSEKDRPSAPEDFIKAFKKGEHHSVYTFQGTTKHSYWLELSNGMTIVVAVPSIEISNTWINMVLLIIFVGLGIIGIFTALTIVSSNKITKPLKELTRAAEQIDKGNYNVKLDYKGTGEIATLTTAFNDLIKNLDEYISDLTSLAYDDALTSVHNKSAFDIYSEELQKRIDNKEETVEFAIALLDCDGLKKINDAYGHDKGDVYLRNSCNLMGRIFEHSVIYRIGGDEFAIILENEDYIHRTELLNRFFERSKEVCSFAKHPWEKIKVSVGIADYDPSIDKNVSDVLIHADHLMYTNKRSRKQSKNS